MFYILKNKKYVLLIFQNITQIVKKRFFLMISNEEKREATSEGLQ